MFFGIKVGEIEEAISDDQDLGENGIYENQQGDMALCFEVDAHLLGRFRVLPDSTPSTLRG